MKRSFSVMAVFAGLVLFAAFDLHAADFYQGKTLRITIGTSPGGGYDAWGRLVGRHLMKHIPGNPSIIAENIPGAGGLIQVNNLFAATKPDGLTIGYILGSLLLTQALGQPGYQFDPQKLICIGAANKENIVLVLSKKSGITSAEKWRASPAPVKFGGLARGSSVDNYLRVIKDVLGFPMQIVSGYKGTTETRLAMESGEVAGGAPSWDSAKTSWKSLIDKGEASIFALGAPRRLKEIPDVPTATEYARTEEEKRILEVVINSMNEYSRPFVLPPGTPRDRVQILRKAFEDMIKDPEFLAEVEKMKVTLDPASAEELTSAVGTLAKIDSALLARLKTILFE
jgi:tripartite-type tricarboxylate transporter receptor subunit TctC